METLMIDGQYHRSQYYGTRFARSPGGFSSFGSPPMRKHEGFINCRSYHSRAGLLPAPFESKSFSETRIRGNVDVLATPETPSPSICFSLDGGKNGGKPGRRSSAVSIPMAMKLDDVGLMGEGDFVDGVRFSELWAGPTYSNSPPPSSLPIPKFSVKSKRTVSLELPRSVSPIELRPVAKSAPASPIRERSPSPIHFLSDVESVLETSYQCFLRQESVDETDFATKALRRMLNLDNDDH